jgi:hypothetical protein
MELAVSGFVLDASSQKNEKIKGRMEPALMKIEKKPPINSAMISSICDGKRESARIHR